MRKYILVALVLTVLGVGISLLLIPTEDDVVRLQARDVAQIDLGNIDLRAEYNQGRRSFPIINALADEMVAAGDRPAAIKILEEYVASNPNDLNAKKRLSDEYLLANDMEKYGILLAEIAESDPTEKNLSILSSIYNGQKNFAKQAEMLTKLIEITNGSNPQYYVDLAVVQSMLNDSEGQLQTITALREKHPSYLSYDMTRAYVSAKASQRELADAQAASEEWMLANPTAADNLADLMNTLNYIGKSPEAALQLASARLNLLPNDADLVLAYVNANIGADRQDTAYKTLQQVEKAGPMPANLYGTYLNLALQRKDTKTASRIIASLDPAQFNEDEALNLLEYARVLETQSAYNALLKRFNDPAALENKVALAAVVSVALDAKDQDARIDTALAAELTDLKRLRVAQVCARASKEMCFDTIVERFPDIAVMTPLQLQQYAQLHIEARRAARIVDAVGALHTSNPQQYIRHQHLRLAAAAGREDVFAQWLAADGQNASTQDINEYFFMASGAGHVGVSSAIAESLFARDPSPENRTLMISSLLSANKKERALEYIRQEAQQNPDNDNLYISVLGDLGKKNAAYKKELVDYVRARIKADQGTAEQQRTYAFVLIGNGYKNEALTLARTKAKTEGGEWRKMLAQLTPAPSSAGGTSFRPLSKAQQIKLARNPKTDENTRKQIAASLLSTGDKQAAAEIFEMIAANKGPESQEVKDLFFVWGTPITVEKMDWMIARAKKAPISEREAWAQLANDFGNEPAVVSYAAKAPDALYHGPLRKRFFNVLAAQGNGDNFTMRMKPWMQQTTDIEALEDYATTALGHSFSNVARETYARIVELDPNNKRALTQLGSLTFANGQIDNSKEILARAVSLPATGNSLAEISGDSQAHYLRAELLKRDGRLRDARLEYERVIALEQKIAATSKLDAGNRTRLFNALFHTGRHQEGMRGFEAMMRSNPSDRSTLANYLSILMEYGYSKEALAAANRYDPRGRRIDGLSAHAPARQPNDLSSNSTMVHEWRAEDGTVYEVHYMPTSNVSYETVAEAETQVPVKVAQARQEEFRLQMLYARIEQETGQAERARYRLKQLAKYYPEEPQLFAYRANLESASGNPPGALRLAEQARALDPANQDLIRLERDLRRNSGTDYARIDHEHRSFGKNNEHITTLSGATRVTDRTELGFVVQNNALRTKNFLDRESGRSGEFDTTRQNGELYASYFYENGSRLKGSVFANNDTPGAGLYYAFNNDFGRTEWLAELRKPYADFPEAAYEHASRDRVGLRHNATIAKNTSLGIETSLNNYNTHLGDNVTKSGLLRMNVIHALRQSQPYVAVGYGFDGEYLIGDQKLGRGQFNSIFKLLPLVTREVHAATVSLLHNITPTTRLSLFGGWTYDRLNEQGPVVDARLTQAITDSLEAGIFARYGRQANESDNNATHLGGHLQYNF